MLTNEVLPLINEAANRVYSLVRETPLVTLGADELQINANSAFAKLEQLQLSGSFKLRGATNKLMSLEPVCGRRRGHSFIHRATMDSASRRLRGSSVSMRRCF